MDRAGSVHGPAFPYTILSNSLHGSQQPMSSIEERVKKIVVEQLGVKEAEVSNSDSFVDDLGADSLANVDQVMELEEDFEFEIDRNRGAWGQSVLGSGGMGGSRKKKTKIKKSKTE